MAQNVHAYAAAVGTTVRSIWHGMSVTLSHLLRRPVTIQYPDRTPLPVRDTLPARYRGLLEVDAAICTGCQACERACPIDCIAITLEKDPTNPKQRLVTQFDIDEAKCMYCGLCVEPCPTGSIQHTREFEASSADLRTLTFRWAEKPFPVYKVPKDATYYPRVPLGSILRPFLEARRWDARGPEFLPAAERGAEGAGPPNPRLAPAQPPPAGPALASASTSPAPAPATVPESETKP